MTKAPDKTGRCKAGAIPNFNSKSNKVETGLAHNKIGMSTNNGIFLEFSPATNTYIPVSRTLNECVWHRETILDFNMATKRFIPLITIQESVDMTIQETQKNIEREKNILAQDIGNLFDYIDYSRCEIIDGEDIPETLPHMADEYNHLLELAKELYPEDKSIQRLKKVYPHSVDREKSEQAKYTDSGLQDLTEEYYPHGHSSNTFQLLKGIDILANHIIEEDKDEIIKSLRDELKEKNKILDGIKKLR